jgi:hypothetical protein
MTLRTKTLVFVQFRLHWAQLQICTSYQINLLLRLGAWRAARETAAVASIQGGVAEARWAQVEAWRTFERGFPGQRWTAGIVF